MQNKDTWTLGGHTFTSRFILGSGKYNLNLIRAAVEDAGAVEFFSGCGNL